MVRRNLSFGWVAALAALASCTQAAETSGPAAPASTPPVAASVVAAAPAFTHTRADDWINSPPLTLEQLRGKVVLVEFWTFDCINCLRSGDWVRKVAKDKAAAGLVVVGVHTPELPQERNAANVRAAVTRLGIQYPVMIDGDFSYWNAMANNYWPAFYLIDADGRVRGHAVGEMHVGERDSQQLERAIDQLLASRG